MEKELEEWKEKCHLLTMTLKSLKQTHQVELEFHKDETTAKIQELSTVNENMKLEFKARERKFAEQITDLTEFLQESRDEGNVLKGQVDQLQKTLEHLKNTQVEKQGRIEQSESIKIREDQLTQDLKSSRNLLEIHQCKLHSLMQLSEQQKETITELREEIDSKDLCISQIQTRLREIETEREEEIALQQAHQMQNHITVEEVCDPTKRGNSLFSELEERRIRVEDELSRLRGRVTRLTVENVDLKASLERGDCRSAIIVTQLQSISKSETELVQALKQLKSESRNLFESYEDRFVALTSEYNKKLSQFKNGLDPSAPQLPELEIMRSERDRLMAQKISQDRELFECRKELKYANQQKISTEANIKILRVKLQALQDQFSKAADDARYKSFTNNAENDNSFNSSSSSSINNSLLTAQTTGKPIRDDGDHGENSKNVYLMERENKKSRAEEIPECKQQ